MTLGDTGRRCQSAHAFVDGAPVALSEPTTTGTTSASRRAAPSSPAFIGAAYDSVAKLVAAAIERRD
jgi:hypothetical protein